MKLKIVSDGTSAGSKLVNEDSGEKVQLVQKLNWKATSDDFLQNTTIDIICVPIEITANATINYYEYDQIKKELCFSDSLKKDVKIQSVKRENSSIVQDIFVYDAITNEEIGAINEIDILIDIDSVNVIIKAIKV